MTSPNGTSWGPPCPVCGRLSAGPGPAPCPSCGLPAVGEAALVVARIGATIEELAHDRERLLATLRAAAPGPPGPVAAPVYPAPAAAPLPVHPEPAPAGPAPAGPAEPPWRPPSGPLPPFLADPAPPRRRVSPQEVLLGLGALLVVAAALAFVAVAWTRLGVAFQAVVMLTVTATACGASAWTARRGLRATEEALAAAGAALLAVDLGAAHALGLGGLDAVPPRLWTAVSCAVVAAAGLGLGRATRSTVAWPLVALLAAQPVPLLLLPPEAVQSAAAVAVALAMAFLDVAVVLRLRRVLVPVAGALAALWAAGAALGGTAAAWNGGPLDSWTATVLLAGAGALLPLLRRRPRLAALLPPDRVAVGTGAGVAALALAGALDGTGAAGPVAAAGLGLGLLAVAVLAARAPTVLPALLAAGATLTAAGSAALLVHGRLGALAGVALGATVPAVLAAVRLPAHRPHAVAVALLSPAVAVLLGEQAGRLTPTVAGLLLGIVAAVGFGLAALTSPAREEHAAAGAGLLAGLAGAGTTAVVGAWGQVAIILAVSAAAAGAYGLVSSRRGVGVGALAGLVAACWTAVAGAGVEAPEAYTLPAAAALLVGALPEIRAGVRSWAAEGPAAVVALVPSALVVVAEPSAVRLVPVVVAAAALTVAGTLAHRQAPFVVGTAALAFVVLGRLGPYAPLVPRWLTLAVVGLLLLVLGATYERRRQQAREAVAWVAQMR
ncbi:SCO7613 C-terminal domain-containing membrane protein [Geodermatophilus sp. CPCC 206100]|uniref:SCO7613 C-terminal domain-containing membrane protein n=1 Tax=Geodermatophilus sp. CPCC 206100 TaxID=3020054 RepID=UPI003B00C319